MIPSLICQKTIRFVGLTIGAAMAFAAVSASADTGSLPQYADDTHLGVTSCAGSTCHGATTPWQDSTVLQTEYVTWHKQDKHAQAYKVLLNERSQRIARNLGLKSAHEADVCLDCHADNPQPNKRSKQFQLSDGVGCEACHGGAARYLGIHISGVADHKANVAAGMYPTEDPVKRAELCLSCHFGNERKIVTHRIMGAGHPRMSFELATFTAIQPAHYKVDADYRKRKAVSDGVQTWAIGQAIAMREIMDAMIDPKTGRDGIFPELVMFDCHACHHPMSNIRWEARDSTGLGPGIPRINDSNLIMLRIIAERIAPEVAASMKAQSIALHQAATKGPDAMAKAAKDVSATASKLVSAFAKHKFSTDDVKGLMSGVVSMGLGGEYVDYAAAEQATMALGSIVQVMKDTGTLDNAKFKSLNDALDKLYDSVKNDEAYKPTQYRSALQGFKAVADKV